MSKNAGSTALPIPFFQVTSEVRSRLLDDVKKLAGQRLMVLGDVGLDEYVLGEVRRISPEAPVPVLEVESQDMRLGLAGNVAQNISALGAHPCLISVVGRDSGADRLRELFHSKNVTTDYLIEDLERPTTRKTRVMAKHHHLVRVDYESRKFLSPEAEAKTVKMIEKVLPQVDGVILEDYAKGLLSAGLMAELLRLCHAHKKPVYVDPHRSNPAEFYKGVDLIKPNFDEALALSGLTYDDLRDSPTKVNQIGQVLLKKTGARRLIVTRGKDGMILFEDDKTIQIPTYARQVFDVTGAGDTVIATLALGLSAGLSAEESAVLANFAAGVVVGQVGCVPCSSAELVQYIRSEPSR